MQISNYQIPLAVYRELAAHLRQIEGIEVDFLQPIDRVFNYTESQLGGLEIAGIDQLDAIARHKFDRILDYYLSTYPV